MSFTLQDLLNAGLPAIYTDGNGSNALTEFSRSLTSLEWQTYLIIADPLEARKNQARTFANAIPNWATWTQTDLQNWWNANLADSIVDSFSVPAAVKTMLKTQNAAILAEGKMIIALRDFVRIIA